MKDLIIIGSGNPDIVRLIEDINADKKQYNLLGFLEKDSSKIGSTILGYPVLGGDDLLLTEFSHCALVNNVMQTPQHNAKIAAILRNKYLMSDFPNLIHPNNRYRYVSMGYGNMVYDGVSLASLVTMGNFNIMHPHSLISHETLIGSNNLISVGVSIGARLSIGDRNFFGMGSNVLSSLTIKDDNLICMGCNLTQSIESMKKIKVIKSEIVDYIFH